MPKYDLIQLIDTDAGTTTTVSFKLHAEPIPDPVPVPDPVPEPTPVPKPTKLTQTVSVGNQGLKVGTAVSLTAKWLNETAAEAVSKSYVIAVRQPGATHTSGPFNMDVVLTGSTLAVNATAQASGNFTPDKSGTWTVYPTYQDANDVWQDGAEIALQVAAANPVPVPTPTPDPTPVPTPTPTPSGFVNPLKSLGSQPWSPDWGGSNPMQGTTTAINPQFVADYKAFGFRVFRAMDAVPVNGSTVVTWSQRVQPNAKQASPGISIEYLIDIANQTSCDLWLCHPYLADDDYIRQCATLVKSRLRADLRVIPELSNEVWNGAFASFNQAIKAGQAGGLPGSNQYYQGIAHEMYRALQMHAIYEEVFGSAAMGSKVIRAFAHSGNLDLTNSALANVYQSSKWNPKGVKLDLLACAPYVGNGTNGATETLARWSGEVDTHVSKEPLATTKGFMSKYGIPLLGLYEFGAHHLQSATNFATSQLAYDCYTYMLDKYMAVVNGPCCLYTSHGVWPAAGASNKGSWGLVQNVGASIDGSPKAKAVRDWIAKNK